MSVDKFDFSGYATKNNLKCSDGRTILKDAFKHHDGKTVPLVWQHLHNEPANILGHARLENREDGVYAYGTFNTTEAGQNASELVSHGDITSLSIYANQLKQNGTAVMHGVIREVSLVLSGANPGALIDNLSFKHGDGDYQTDETEAIIYTGLELKHMSDSDGQRILADELGSLTDDQKTRLRERTKYMIDDTQMDVIFNTIRAMTDSQRLSIYKSVADNIVTHGDTEEALIHAAHSKDATVQEVFDTLDEVQKSVVYAMIGEALAESGVKHSTSEGEEIMKNNVFENKPEVQEDALSHADMEAIIIDAKRYGSLRDSALAHGIENIEYLFPEARNLNTPPHSITREMNWVSKVFNGTHKTPFSRIRSTFADLTEDEARAKGFMKGNKKVEEVFSLLKRTTTPQTVYKKQKLDRDDVVDITDFDVVAWLKSEMRMMLDEELARAILIGDGRLGSSDDKIKEDNIRPIWKDDNLFTIKTLVETAANATDDQKIRAFIRASVKSRKGYKGSGEPTLYTTEDVVTDCLLMEDTTGRIIYDSISKLTTALRVREIVTVPVMENQTRVDGADTLSLMGIIVNLSDYNVGADRGGAVNMFEDFDIDYNAQKYLIETRCSGALIRPFSAIAIEVKTNG